jgi:HD-GYP domain-containing protein (c-di-GMP phosphodiesterase class II)
MNFTLLHLASFDVGPIAEALESEGVLTRVVTDSEELLAVDSAAVLVLDAASRATFSPEQLRSFTDSGGAVVALGAEGEHDLSDELDEDLLAGFVRVPYGGREILLALRTAYREAIARADSSRARKEAATRTKELGELTRIGMALSTEHDYEELQDLILSQARELSSSDAASLYLVERLENDKRRLRFKLSQTFSRPDIPLVERTMPLDKSSIAGYVATTGEPLVIDDAYFLPPDSEYNIDRFFDQKYGYRTKSMLTIPMTDHKKEVIGVLQLINRKRDFSAHLEQPEDFDQQVIPYTRRLVELVSALAGQAAVSIENSQLYEEIERLFEGFVRASVHAIEQRDPTTFGHSGRVADKTVALAEVVDRADVGAYRSVTFTKKDLREIRYAGLLHDFGKVGVREEVLVKAKKLYPPDLALIRQRYAFVRRTAEREFFRRRLEYLETSGQAGYEQFMEQLDAEHRAQMEDLDHFMKLVLESNEPTVLPEGSFEELVAYADRYFEDLEGNQQPYLTDDEARFLTIRKGSLDEQERAEIESHVTHTYKFLQKIPWTRELGDVPVIAWGHHEKLDGSGYPRRLKGSSQIPIQTRMMTIADIYDALTAADRPYKRRMAPERALDIIGYEVKDGQIDADLFGLFIEGEVFKRVEEA